MPSSYTARIVLSHSMVVQTVIIPVDADDREVAALLRSAEGTDGQVRVELAPAWNGAAPEFQLVNQRGSLGGLPGANAYTRGAAWHVYRALQVFALAQQQLGADRVVRVYRLGGNKDMQREVLAAVLGSSWNGHNQAIDELLE